MGLLLLLFYYTKIIDLKADFLSLPMIFINSVVCKTLFFLVPKNYGRLKKLNVLTFSNIQANDVNTVYIILFGCGSDYNTISLSLSIHIHMYTYISLNQEESNQVCLQVDLTFPFFSFFFLSFLLFFFVLPWLLSKILTRVSLISQCFIARFMKHDILLKKLSRRNKIH